MRSIWLGASLRALATRSPLALLNGVIPPDACQVAEGISYGCGPRQQLDIYAPWQAAGAPVVVFFYGGSWRSGARADYKFVGDALVSRGYVTAIADYQLYPRAAYPDFLHDCARAVAWIAQHCARYGGDPARLYLVGHSAGAYNAAMLALDRRWLQAHGRSPSMLAGWVGMAGPYDFLPLTDPDFVDMFGHDPAGQLASQPVHFVDGDEPPMLLLQGRRTASWPRATRRPWARPCAGPAAARR